MFFKNAKLLKEANVEIENLEAEISKLKEKYEYSISNLEEDNSILKQKYSSIINVDNEIILKKDEILTIENNISELNNNYIKSIEIYDSLKKEIELYNDILDIRTYGLYEPRFAFDTSEEFKIAIDINYQKQKDAIKEINVRAIVSPKGTMVDGSKVEGEKMMKRYKKLMLYAFNGECDSLISEVKWNNISRINDKIEKSFIDINKLGEVVKTFITDYYKNLKIEAALLFYEYEEKKHQEKEEQRRIKEQMREEEKALKEFEKAQKDAEEEETRYQKALDKARNELGSVSKYDIDELNSQIQLLENKLKDAQERKERAMSMAQMTKVGHIYVITNIGAFGEDVVKIGMTRRLDPLDRVKELGDASVPFQFDIHAIIYSENAPQLENELHKRFHDRRLNKINHRKEFFKVSLDEIELFVNEHINAKIEFTKIAEAREFRETVSILQTSSHVIVEKQSIFPTSLI
jgi:hypothetical protein